MQGDRNPGRRAARGLPFVAAAAVVATLVGCAAPVQRQTPELRREAGKTPRIVVMPLDVELSQLTAGGLQAPHSEWTDAALKHMRVALEQEARSRNVVLVDFQGDRGTPADRDTSLDLVKLHRAVGGAVLVHQYLPSLALPSKDGKFDWSLGPSVAAIARTHEADYALFLYVRDSYATAGRVAVIIVGALLVAPGLLVPGGSQVGFASVVDLKTGDIVWFNRVIRGYGDLRTPEAAAETVKALVSDSLQ
ncbi:MAG TPA: hypothetical protein VKC64_06810 [Burkholderiales bacterium]|nr:hypothetical protein [Burkholderiales bacterium]